MTVGAETAPAELLLDGIVEAVNQATLSAQTAGRVAEVKVEVNDRVQAGRTAAAPARNRAGGWPRPGPGARCKAAQAQDAQARAQHDRIRDMYERKVVARATYDDAVAARDAAAADLAATRAGVEVGARRRRLHRTARAVRRRRHREARAGRRGRRARHAAADRSRRSTRCASSPKCRRARPTRCRQRAQATVYVGEERIAATGITLYPSAEPQSGTFRARVDLPETAHAAGARHVSPRSGSSTGEASRILVPCRRRRRTQRTARRVRRDAGRSRRPAPGASRPPHR